MDCSETAVLIGSRCGLWSAAAASLPACLSLPLQLPLQSLPRTAPPAPYRAAAQRAAPPVPRSAPAPAPPPPPPPLACLNSPLMKFQGPDTELLGMPADSLLMGACWGPSPDQYKLLLDGGPDDKGALDSLDTKVAMDTLDSLLLSSTDDDVSDSFAELKPLPPFTGYTGHLSINGISGHHYHAIAAPLSPEHEPGLCEANNNSQVTNHNHVSNGHGHGSASSASSTGSNGSSSVNSSNVLHFKGGSEQGGATLYYSADHGVVSSSTGLDCGDIKEEASDYTSLLDNEDIAALIGSAIADTTVPSVVDNDASRDSWMDLDAWIDGACSSDSKAILSADSLQDFTAVSSQFSVSPPPAPTPGPTAHTTLQSLLGYPVQTQQQQQQQAQPQTMLVKREAVTTSFSPSNSHGLLVKREATTSFPQPGQQPPQHVSLLHSRLQNGPPPSPPSHVVSTTDPGHGHGMRYHYSPTSTTTHTGPSPSKKSRNRSKNKGSGGGGGGGGGPTSSSILPSSSSHSLVYSADGLLGKEKPVHRCSICSRGFLNKSNIKVHLRTHTGEKPFRCEVCGKAFRQKAHLLKHAMIHKRIGRDDPHGYPHEALRCD